jgi:hypothetical protein
MPLSQLFVTGVLGIRNWNHRKFQRNICSGPNIGVIKVLLEEGLLPQVVSGRGFHSSTSQLNLRRLCH